jgi:hypothetical protein
MRRSYPGVYIVGNALNVIASKRVFQFYCRLLLCLKLKIRRGIENKIETRHGHGHGRNTTKNIPKQE